MSHAYFRFTSLLWTLYLMELQYVSLTLGQTCYLLVPALSGFKSLKSDTIFVVFSYNVRNMSEKGNCRRFFPKTIWMFITTKQNIYWPFIENLGWPYFVFTGHCQLWQLLVNFNGMNYTAVVRSKSPLVKIYVTSL